MDKSLLRQVEISTRRLDHEYDNLQSAMTWSQSAAGDVEMNLKLAVQVAGFQFDHGWWNDLRTSE